MSFPVQTNRIPLTIVGEVLPPQRQIDPKAISRSLKVVGLNCDDNSSQSVDGMIAVVKASVPATGQKFQVVRVIDPNAMVTRESGDTPAKPSDGYNYQIASPELVSYESQLNKVLDNFELVSANHLYTVSSKNLSQTVTSTTYGLIQDIFKAAASVLGEVQGGHIDPVQVAGHLETVITGITETKSNAVHEDNSEFWFLTSPVVKAEDGTSSVSEVSALWYHYVVDLSDIGDSKSTTHKGSVTITTHSVAFSDIAMLAQICTQIDALKAAPH